MTSTAAQAAKLIRQELKAAFPRIKFSVTSENFSMGNAVNIFSDCADSPSRETLRAMLDKYSDSDFDGMTDSTTYRPDNGLPRVSFVKISVPFKREAAQA